MATPTNYISKITATNGTTYDIYDANAVHDVDTALSDTSTNPVQNKVVTKQKKTAIDIGALSLVDFTTYYNTTLSSQILTDINAMTSYEGFGLTFSGVISSSTVVFNVWQTAARTISNVNWIIFSGVYGEPDTGSSPQTKMCTVSVNMTTGALYIYPITVAVASHTHNLGITAGTSSDTSQITLSHGTKYVLSAGGSTYCFTMPSGGGTGTITGGGISGYLAKWTGASGQTSTELTAGPAIGTSTKQFLREDGNWAKPFASQIYMGWCDTARAMAAKTVTLDSSFELVANTMIMIRFANGNSAATPTLNVNSLGAKSITFNSQSLNNSVLPSAMAPNTYLILQYTGSSWTVMSGYNNYILMSPYMYNVDRVTSLNRSYSQPVVEYLLATSATTTGKTPIDAHVLSLNWDNNSVYAAQLAVANGSSTVATPGRIFSRGQLGTAATWSDWLEVPRLSGALTNNQIVVSDESTGTALLKGGPTIGTGTTKFLREDGTWAVPSGSGSSVWTESTTHGAVYPADAVLTGNTFADGSLTIIGQDLKDTTGMATGIGSINMAAYGTLSCSAQSGVTSYTIASGLNAIGANSNSYDYVKSLYFFTKNGKKALKPTSVTLSGSSTVLTFSESLNPTAAITYLGYYNNCSGANSLVTAMGATNSANCNVVVGSRVVNSGFYSTVGGLRNSNSGNGCGVFGRNSINTGAYSFIAGSNNTNTKSEACLIGKGHDSSSGPDSVTAVGQYSAIASTTAFAVGNGADMASRSNAFEVHTDGRATVGAAPTADMDVATKKYVDDNSGGGGTVDSARSTSSTNALQNSVITNFTQTLPLPVYTTAGATPTSAITCIVNSNSIVGDKIMTQDGWIGTVSSITNVGGIYSASATITGTNWMAPRKVTVGTTQYTITRKALEIVDGSTTTTYYIADIT